MPRVRMILGKAGEIIVESVKAGRRENSGLAHRAAKHPPRTVRAGDIIATPGDHATDRATKPLRQRDRDEIEGSSELGQGPSARCRGIEEARAIEIARKAELAGGRADRDGVVLREDHAATPV